MRAADNKVFLPVGGRPLIAWSARTFANAASVEQIVIVARRSDRERLEAVVARAGVDVPVHMTTGGARRQDSERCGLDLIAREPDLRHIDVVLVHDAARPFVSGALVDLIAATAAAVGGAVPAVPLGAGVYRARDDGRLETQKDDLYRVQTPQGFRTAELIEAYRRAEADDFAGLDTAETVQRYTQLEVAVVAGEPENIKLTFAGDLVAAEVIARRVAS